MARQRPRAAERPGGPRVRSRGPRIPRGGIVSQAPPGNAAGVRGSGGCSGGPGFMRKRDLSLTSNSQLPKDLVREIRVKSTRNPRSVGFRAVADRFGSWKLGIGSCRPLRFSPALVMHLAGLPISRYGRTFRLPGVRQPIAAVGGRAKPSGIAPNRELIGLHESCTTADCPGPAVTPRR